jgi:N-acetylglucosaminyldiphosphoundecaprenol N-acetyl-beta-D-mannosaminyltransferase
MSKFSSIWTTAISKLNLVQCDDQINKLLQNTKATNEPVVIGFLNAYAFNSLLDNPSFFNSLKCMDIVFRDGIGAKILLKLLGKNPGKNMNGTDFIPTLLERYRGKRIAILATEEPFLSKTKDIVEQTFAVDVVVLEDGFQPDDYYSTRLSKNPVELVILGMGMPKQERVACELKNTLDYPVLIVCGGAIIDFYAQRVTRAPEWMRKTGMEWIYRFLLEPKRLFKRYIFGNVIFLLRALFYKVSTL